MQIKSSTMTNDVFLMTLLQQQMGWASEADWASEEGQRRQQVGAEFEAHVGAQLQHLIAQQVVVANYPFASNLPGTPPLVVEFALRLGRVMVPIDAKFIASAGKSPTDLDRIMRDRARQVRKYVDPPYTPPFALMVIDDDVWKQSSRRPFPARAGAVILPVAVSNLLPLVHTMLFIAQHYGGAAWAVAELRHTTAVLHQATARARISLKLQQMVVGQLESVMYPAVTRDGDAPPS